MKVQRSITCNADANCALKVIANVMQYPEFLPFIRSVTVKNNHMHQTNNSGIKSYDIIIAAMGLQYEFSGQVEATNEYVLDLKQLQGPFSQFIGQWSIEPRRANQCSITISSSFQFKALSHRLLFKTAQNKIFSQLETKFKQRIEAQFRIDKNSITKPQ